MDTTLIYYLIACLISAALLYYVYVVRGASDLGAGGRAALVVIAALLIPVLIVVLWQQHKSFHRLEDLGFAIHGELRHNVGVAAGIGPEPTWLYATDAPARDIVNFYRSPAHHRGWTLVEATDHRLSFRQDGMRMDLFVNDAHVAFTLIERAQ